MTTKIGPMEFEETMRQNAFTRTEGGEWVRSDRPEIAVAYTLDGVIFQRRLAPGLGVLKVRVVDRAGLFGILRAWQLIAG